MLSKDIVLKIKERIPEVKDVLVSEEMLVLTTDNKLDVDFAKHRLSDLLEEIMDAGYVLAFVRSNTSKERYYAENGRYISR